ncbi:MAG TPA: hypothetical protein VF604_18495 [Pyrinomonadaceae bacterium]|jgi:hypothetical protein
MAEQQNSGTGNTGNFGNQSTGSGGSGASTQAAKDNTSLTGGESGSESAGTLGNVTNKVKGLYQTAADSQVGQVAKDALGQVKDNASTAIDDKKANLAQGLTSVADTLRQVGDTLKPAEGEPPANKVAELTTQYTESLSQQVEKISGYLERQDMRGLMSDLEGFARRNPAIFLGGAFALGILAARFLKSSNPNQALIKTSDVSDFDSGFDTTPSSLGSASTGSSFNEPSAGSFGQTGSSLGDKGDSFGGTSGAFDSEADNVRQFNTGSGAGSSTTSGSGAGSIGTGSTATGSTGSLEDSSSTSSNPSNKTGDDFGSSKF